MKKLLFGVILLLFVNAFTQVNTMALSTLVGAKGQAFEYSANEILIKALPKKKNESGEKIAQKDFTQNLQKLILRGKAFIHFKKDNVKIWADTIEYDKTAGKITADKNVKVEQNTVDKSGKAIHIFATSDLMILFLNEKKLVMEKNPVIIYNKSKIMGDKIIIFQDKDGAIYMNVLSGKKKKAQGIYVPEKQKVNEKQNAKNKKMETKNSSLQNKKEEISK